MSHRKIKLEVNLTCRFKEKDDSIQRPAAFSSFLTRFHSILNVMDPLERCGTLNNINIQ